MAELPFMKMKLRMTVRSPGFAVSSFLRQMERHVTHMSKGMNAPMESYVPVSIPPTPPSKNHPQGDPPALAPAPHWHKFSPSARGKLLVRM